VCFRVEVNAVTVPHPFLLPRVEDLLDRVSEARYLTKLDMTPGYVTKMHFVLIPIALHYYPIDNVAIAAKHLLLLFSPDVRVSLLL